MSLRNRILEIAEELAKRDSRVDHVMDNLYVGLQGRKPEVEDPVIKLVTHLGGRDLDERTSEKMLVGFIQEALDHLGAALYADDRRLQDKMEYARQFDAIDRYVAINARGRQNDRRGGSYGSSSGNQMGSMAIPGVNDRPTSRNGDRRDPPRHQADVSADSRPVVAENWKTSPVQPHQSVINTSAFERCYKVNTDGSLMEVIVRRDEHQLQTGPDAQYWMQRIALTKVMDNSLRTVSFAPTQETNGFTDTPGETIRANSISDMMAKLQSVTDGDKVAMCHTVTVMNQLYGLQPYAELKTIIRALAGNSAPELFLRKLADYKRQETAKKNSNPFILSWLNQLELTIRQFMLRQLRAGTSQFLIDMGDCNENFTDVMQYVMSLGAACIVQWNLASAHFYGSLCRTLNDSVLSKLEGSDVGTEADIGFVPTEVKVLHINGPVEIYGLDQLPRNSAMVLVREQTPGLTQAVESMMDAPGMLNMVVFQHLGVTRLFSVHPSMYANAVGANGQVYVITPFDHSPEVIMQSQEAVVVLSPDELPVSEPRFSR